MVDKCPVTSCSLKKLGCIDDYNGVGVVIGKAPEFIFGYK